MLRPDEPSADVVPFATCVRIGNRGMYDDAIPFLWPKLSDQFMIHEYP